MKDFIIESTLLSWWLCCSHVSGCQTHEHCDTSHSSNFKSFNGNCWIMSQEREFEKLFATLFKCKSFSFFFCWKVQECKVEHFWLKLCRFFLWFLLGKDFEKCGEEKKIYCEISAHRVIISFLMIIRKILNSSNSNSLYCLKWLNLHYLKLNRASCFPSAF